jgi:hypothetical protein
LVNISKSKMISKKSLSLLIYRVYPDTFIHQSMSLPPDSSFFTPIPIPPPYSPQDDKKIWKMNQKSYRLLLLHHVLRCKVEGPCDVSPLCKALKTMLKHFKNCEKDDCEIPWCKNYRLIIWHYKKCEDRECLICTPVRNASRQYEEDLKKGMMHILFSSNLNLISE